MSQEQSGRINTTQTTRTIARHSTTPHTNEATNQNTETVELAKKIQATALNQSVYLFIEGVNKMFYCAIKICLYLFFILHFP